FSLSETVEQSISGRSLVSQKKALHHKIEPNIVIRTENKNINNLFIKIIYQSKSFLFKAFCQQKIAAHDFG
ncbi:CLUMA_CG007882, isoform D, partial [Clunio marinus]